jgi:hypothetical protein
LKDEGVFREKSIEDQGFQSKAKKKLLELVNICIPIELQTRPVPKVSKKKASSYIQIS